MFIGNCLSRAASRCPLFWVALIAGISAQNAYAWGVYVEQKTFAHSESAPFGAITEGWSVPMRLGGTSAQGYLWHEAGIRYSNWSVGALYRYDSRIKYSPDMLEFTRAIKTHQPLDVGRQYSILLDVHRFEGRGARVAYTFHKDNHFQMTIGGAYFQTSALLSGKLQGSVTAVSEKTYDLNADLDYFYDKDAFFERKVAAPQGSGYALDVNFRWKTVENIVFEGEVLDLYGVVHWPSAPRTTGHADSATKQIDPTTGYQFFNPLLSGRESTEPFDQRLPPRARVDLQKTIDAWLLKQRMLYAGERWYASIGGGYKSNAFGEFFGLYTLNANGLSAGWRGSHWSVEAGSDHWNPRRAHFGVISVSWIYDSQ